MATLGTRAMLLLLLLPAQVLTFLFQSVLHVACEHCCIGIVVCSLLVVAAQHACMQIMQSFMKLRRFASCVCL